MMAEALKTLGNEAFKNNDFAKAIEHFTEAIGIDGTNHVLYSNRSAARVRR
jgi:stress-induced-phosphoprotein 1